MVHFWFGFFFAAMVQGFLKLYVRMILQVNLIDGGNQHQQQRNDIRQFSGILLVTPSLALSFVVTWFLSWSIFGNDDGFWIFWTYVILLSINAVRLNDYLAAAPSRRRFYALFHKAIWFCTFCFFFLSITYWIIFSATTDLSVVANTTSTTPEAITSFTTTMAVSTTSETTTNQSTSQTSNTPPTTASGCVFPDYQGDQFCDDENNNANCHYDGGDCCGSNVNITYCTQCLCLDPSHQTTGKLLLAYQKFLPTHFIFLVVEFFLIINHLSGKALQASTNNSGEIVIWTIHGYDNQLWFWDQQEEDVLRNKMFPNKVVNDKAYIVTALCIPLS